MTDTDEQDDKVRENRLRRMAERQGFALSKNRRRDPQAWDYGLWFLINPDLNAIVLENVHLDDVEEWLNLPWEAEPKGGTP
jgi:hypothetical protein